MTLGKEQGETIRQLPHSKGLVDALRFGEKDARKRNCAYLHSENFFLGLTQDNAIKSTLHRLNGDQKIINVGRKIVVAFIRLADISGYRIDPERAISPTPHLKKILELANIEANQANAREINPIHALIGTILVKQGSSFVHIDEVLFQMGITEKDIPALRERAKELDLRSAGLL